METQYKEIKDVRKRDWHRHNLSKAVFINKLISVDSNDVRSCDDVRELRAVGEFLNNHITEIRSKNQTSKIKGYYFTQRSLLSQVEWSIFKLKIKKQKLLNK